MRKIESDTYFISSRIKEIDPDYFIVYNEGKHRFEVHNAAQGQSTYALTLPFEELDARTLNLVEKTRIANKDKLIEEMERENQKRGGSYFACQ